MTQSKHTPGPWMYQGAMNCDKIKVGTCDRDICLQGLKDSICVLQMPGGYNGIKQHSETVANARLIAAAPEMLEALEECLGALTGGLDGKWSMDIDPAEEARKAIAKAKGEAQ